MSPLHTTLARQSLITAGKISKLRPHSLVSSHGFHTSPTTSSSSPLFHLAALSNSRESQHFRKSSRLSQVEHSTALQLIRSSEVDPFGRAKKLTTNEPSPSSTVNSPYGTTRASSITNRLEKAAFEKVGEVVKAVFPDTTTAAPTPSTNSSTEKAQPKPEPWKQYGISQAEYAALQSLEEGGNSAKARKMREHASRWQAQHAVPIRRTDAEVSEMPDERLWGPGANPQGDKISDGEWMASVMQFKNQSQEKDILDSQVNVHPNVRFVSGAQKSYGTQYGQEETRGSGRIAIWVLVSSLVTGLAVWNLKPDATPLGASVPTNQLPRAEPALRQDNRTVASVVVDEEGKAKALLKEQQKTAASTAQHMEQLARKNAEEVVAKRQKGWASWFWDE